MGVVISRLICVGGTLGSGNSNIMQIIAKRAFFITSDGSTIVYVYPVSVLYWDCNRHPFYISRKWVSLTYSKMEVYREHLLDDLEFTLCFGVCKNV